MTITTKLFLVVMSCWRSGLMWTQMQPGRNCLESLSHMQCVVSKFLMQKVIHAKSNPCKTSPVKNGATLKILGEKVVKS